MKTNKILLFLVAVGLLGGNVVAMNRQGDEIEAAALRESALNNRDRALSAKQKGEDWSWGSLLCYSCPSFRVEATDIIGFIRDNDLSVIERDKYGKNAIEFFLAREFGFCNHNKSRLCFFGYCLCQRRSVELFGELLKMGAVEKYDIEYAIKYHLEMHLRFEIRDVSDEGRKNILCHVLCKAMLECETFHFRLCEELLSCEELFDHESLCVIRNVLSASLINSFANVIRRGVSSEDLFRLWINELCTCCSSALSGLANHFCRYYSTEGGACISKEDVSKLYRLIVEYKKRIKVYEEIGREGGVDVVSVSKKIISVLLELDHDRYFNLRPVALFKFVDDLITGVSRNKEIEIQDICERVSFLRDTANQQVAGQEEDEQDGGARGDVLGINFTGGGRLVVPNKYVFLSQK